MGEWLDWTLVAKRSILLRKRIMAVRENQVLFTMLSKRRNASSI